MTSPLRHRTVAPVLGLVLASSTLTAAAAASSFAFATLPSAARLGFTRAPTFYRLMRSGAWTFNARTEEELTRSPTTRACSPAAASTASTTATA